MLLEAFYIWKVYNGLGADSDCFLAPSSIVGLLTGVRLRVNCLKPIMWINEKRNRQLAAILKLVIRHMVVLSVNQMNFAAKGEVKMKKTLPGWSFKNYLRYKIIRGSLVVSCIVLLAAAGFTSAWGENYTLFEKSCGTDNSTVKKVLIAYDTKHGSTADIAEKIGDVLCENGLRVDIRLAYHVEDISAYDAIIIGSPVYYATFLSGTLQFLNRHKTTLANKTVAAFVVSVDVDKATGMVKNSVLSMVKNTVFNKFSEITIIEPVGLLPGKFYFKEIFPIEIVGFKLAGFAESGDLMNDAFVRAWAEQIAPLLK
jgi:menaquinone-dependent protoporphyrinogen oxidase